MDAASGGGRRGGPRNRVRSGWRRPRRSLRSLGRRDPSCPGSSRSRSGRRNGHARAPASSRTSVRTPPTREHHRFDYRRALPVAELSHVVVARLSVRQRRRVQPRKMSLAACIRRWPATTRCALLAYRSRHKPFQHRSLRLLDLEEQRITRRRPTSSTIQHACRHCPRQRPCAPRRRG